MERLADHLEDRFDALHGDRAPPPATGPCAPRSAGATSCATPRSACSGPGCRSSRETSTRRPPCGCAATGTWSTCTTSWQTSWRSRFSSGFPAATGSRERCREHGREQLARLDDEERLTRRHRYHYLDLARQADADWYGPRQEEWADRLNFSVTNLRLALDSDSPSTSLSIELAGTLWILWFCLGRLREGRYYMKRVIDAGPSPIPGCPDILWTDGCVAVAQGDLEFGRLGEAALSAALDWGDDAAAGHAQLRLARRSLFAGSLDEVEPAVDLVREYFRKAEAVTVDEPIALVTLATAATWRGEFAKVVSVLEEVQRLCDARGELWVRACGDYVLSIAQLGLGRAAEATAAARQSLDVKWRLRDAVGVALALDQLAVIAAVEGDGRRTARLQGSVARLCDTFGLRGLGSKSVSEPRTVAERTARQLLGDDTYDAIFTEGHDDDLDSAMAYALG